MIDFMHMLMIQYPTKRRAERTLYLSFLIQLTCTLYFKNQMESRNIPETERIVAESHRKMTVAVVVTKHVVLLLTTHQQIRSIQIGKCEIYYTIQTENYPKEDKKDSDNNDLFSPSRTKHP